MSNVTLTSRELDERLDRSFVLGKSSMQEHVVLWLKKKSGDYFSVGRDMEARLIRDLANEIDKKQP